jgi:PQQ-like domain
MWKAETAEPASFQLMIAGGRVYAATNQGSLFCLNTNDVRDDGCFMRGASAAHDGLPDRPVKQLRPAPARMGRRSGGQSDLQGGRYRLLRPPAVVEGGSLARAGAIE